MNTLRMASLALALLITASVDLFAQRVPPVAAGDRVRVSRLGTVPPVVCTVLALKADTLVLDAEDRVATLEVPLSLVKKVEVSRGQKSNAGSGALKGGLIGAGIGAVLGGAAWLGSDSDDFIKIGPEAVAVGAAVLGGVGAFAGLLIGAATVSDRWEEVPLHEINLGRSSIAVDGVEVSIALRL
jgi:hypothetical protein